MDFESIRNLIHRVTGLHPASVGVAAVDRVILKRMKKLGIATPNEYERHLSMDTGELQELIESVVIPETWFFRHAAAFDTVRRLVLEKWLPRKSGQMLRILSLPCSTGEEPYSVAMTLLHSGIPAEQFEIDAVDISARALAHARLAIYDKYSFRGAASGGYRERYFHSVKEGYRLHNSVRSRVHFRQANPLHASFDPGATAYFAIFCRNLLIYFDPDTQQRFVGIVRTMLADDGYLFVGPAEMNVATAAQFVSAKEPMAFACRPKTSGDQAGRQMAVDRGSRRLRLNHVRPPAPAPRPSKPAAPVVDADHQTVMTLDEIRQLADLGRLSEACEAGEQHLRVNGPSADLYYICGLVHDGLGHPDLAREYYRKTIYLEPGHSEALLHTGLLSARHGDLASAERFWGRARRSENGILR